MGFRFNKTFKTQYVDTITSLLDHNPGLKYWATKEDTGLRAALAENDSHKFSSAIGRWKFLGLIAAPICTFMVYKVYSYEDPEQMDIINALEREVMDAEKELLEEEI